jgi:hypothetical protein
VTAPSAYTPSYKTPNTWDCITVVSDFPDTVPAHPLDILPCVAPEPVTLCSLMRSWPYTTHRFTEFCPQHTDGDPLELWLAPRGHFTHAHTLEHSTFCREHICPTHSLMVVTDWLSSYLLILSSSPWIFYRSLLLISLVFQLLLAHYCSLSSYCSLVFQLASYRLAIVPSLA